MAFSDFEDIDFSPSSSFFDDIYPDYPTQTDTNTNTNTMPPLNCDCGHEFLDKASLNTHKMTCSERVAKAAVKDILREEDDMKEQNRPAAEEGSVSMDFFARSRLSPNTFLSINPRSPQAANPLPERRRMYGPPQNFMVDNMCQPTPTFAPQQPSYADSLDPDIAIQQTYPQRQLGYDPANNPYLNPHAQNSRYQSHGPGMESNPLSSGYPLSLPQVSNMQSSNPDAQNPSPPTRSGNSSVLSIAGQKLKRVGTSVSNFLTGKSRGRPKKRSHSPSMQPDEAKTKQRKINNAKQQKCRQRKADNQEALEAEVQRSRAILRTLGGSGQGEPVAGTNWH
jgi:hypothetical protein